MTLPSSRVWPAALIVAAAGSSLLLARACGSRTVLTPADQRGAPRELSFETLDGGQWRLSSERGHVVAVNLWATWCEPCRAEIPFFVKLQSELNSSGLRFAGVSLDSAGNRQELVSRFRSNFRINYPIGFPPPLSQMESGLAGIPTTLLFDRDGRTAEVYVGEVDQRSFRSEVAALLREQQGTRSRSER